MNRKLIWSIAAVMLAIVSVSAVAQRHSGTRGSHSADGKASAPDFALQTVDGTTVRLSDYHGKVILLNFWATWCAPCKQEIPRFIEWQRRYDSKGLQVIGLSLDDTADPVRKYAHSINVNYPVALANEQVASLFGNEFARCHTLLTQFARGWGLLPPLRTIGISHPQESSKIVL